MKGKKVLIALAIAAVTMVPFSVFAATSDTSVARSVRGFFGIDTSKLTDAQKADVKDYSQKMADLQKDFINKMVENGALTQEQADAQIKKIDDMLKNGGENGLLPGFGRWKSDFRGPGRPGGSEINGLDTSKLTDAQKADLVDSYKKMADLQKELINKMVSEGLMTQEQGDASLKKVDEILAGIQQNGSFKGFGMMMGGFGFFGEKGMNSSKLTDQQKADLQDFSKKMADLQKELINKMVANGAMTQEQGDAAIQRIDNPAAYSKEKGMPNGKGMSRERFGKSGRQRDAAASSTPTPVQ